jgi:hypothetical protein
MPMPPGAGRVATGAALEVIVAATHPLAPRTCEYTGLDPARLAAGATRAELAARWAGFARPGDVLCTWGPTAADLLAASGVALPAERLDLREAARTFVGGRVGTSATCLPRLGAAARPPLGAGRAGARLGELVGIADFFVAVGRAGG